MKFRKDDGPEAKLLAKSRVRLTFDVTIACAISVALTAVVGLNFVEVVEKLARIFSK